MTHVWEAVKFDDACTVPTPCLLLSAEANELFRSHIDIILTNMHSNEAVVTAARNIIGIFLPML